MAFDRTWAINYLQDRYAAIASKARVNATDTSDGYKSVLDNSLTLLGFSDDELPSAIPSDDKLKDYKAILEYYALDKFYFNFSVQSDTTFTNPGINSKRSGFFKNIEKLKNDAAATVAGLGYDVPSDDAWQESYLYYYK